MIENLLELVEYLNNNNYSISHNEIEDFIKFFSSNFEDITTNKEFSEAFSIYISKSKEEQRILFELLMLFFERKEEIKKQETKYKKLLDKKDRTNKEKSEEIIFKSKMSLENTIKDLEDLKHISKSIKENPTKEKLNKERSKLINKSIKFLQKGKTKEFSEVTQEQKILEKIIKNYEKYEKVKKEASSNQKEKELQDKIDKLLKSLSDQKSGIVKRVKRNSLDEDIFITDENLEVIKDSIKNNKNKFKTKLSRIVNSQERKRLSIKETIKSACKTNGLPMNLRYTKTKPSKAKLVLLLDISGSCSSASSVMITLAHYFRELFPGGTKVFAFVDTLYDISKILKTQDIVDSTESIFKTIPTRGVFSDYYKPLKTMWEKYNKEITDETILIVIGDARNNQNLSGENYYKLLSEKAKKMVFFNTERCKFWSTGDSIANIYQRYSPMYEVVTLSDLEDTLSVM